MDDPAVISAAHRIRLNAEAILAGTQQPEVKRQLIANVDDAVARGWPARPVFGTELYFSKDRLRDVEGNRASEKNPDDKGANDAVVRSAPATFSRSGRSVGKMNGLRRKCSMRCPTRCPCRRDSDSGRRVDVRGPHTTAGLDLPRFAAFSEGGNRRRHAASTRCVAAPLPRRSSWRCRASRSPSASR